MHVDNKCFLPSHHLLYRYSLYVDVTAVAARVTVHHWLHSYALCVSMVVADILIYQNDLRAGMALAVTMISCYLLDQ